jgi:hypothetical protein
MLFITIGAFEQIAPTTKASEKNIFDKQFARRQSPMDMDAQIKRFDRHSDDCARTSHFNKRPARRQHFKRTSLYWEGSEEKRKSNQQFCGNHTFTSSTLPNNTSMNHDINKSESPNVSPKIQLNRNAARYIPLNYQDATILPYTAPIQNDTTENYYGTNESMACNVRPKIKLNANAAIFVPQNYQNESRLPISANIHDDTSGNYYDSNQSTRPNMTLDIQPNENSEACIQITYIEEIQLPISTFTYENSLGNYNLDEFERNNEDLTKTNPSDCKLAQDKLIPTLYNHIRVNTLLDDCDLKQNEGFIMENQTGDEQKKSMMLYHLDSPELACEALDLDSDGIGN